MRLNRFIASTLLTGLFVTTSMLTPALGQEKSLQPQGAWSVSKVDRSAQGGNSYCTLSRKYDEGIVLSLGRSQTEEYSLAIDFQKPAFAKDKAVKINLQPGPGQIRAYDMMPSSDKAVVVRLGWDTGFFDTLNKSQSMKVKIADQSYAFAMPEIAKGQSDLHDCMEELKTAAKGKSGGDAGTKDVLAAQAGSGSKAFDASKVEEGMKSAGAINAQKQLANGEKAALKNFADQMNSQEAAAGDEGKASRKNFAKTVKPGSDEDAELSTRSKAPMPPSSDDFDHKLSAADSPGPLQKPDDIKIAKTEVPRGPDDVPAPVAATKSDKKAAAKSAKSDSKAEMASETEKHLAETAPSASADPARASIEIKSMEDRIAQLSAENAALKQKPAAVQADPAQQKMLESLQQERMALQDQLKAMKDQMAQTPKADDVAKIEAKANELEIRNKQLEEALKSAQTRIGETAINTEGKALRQIADLQSKLDAAQKDNNELAKQLDSLKLRQEDTGIAAIGGDWNLEQATKRYNEAEREIRRLGQQLEQERMSCNREKAEIEQMLFDPAVADQKQIQKLSQLQSDLAAAQAKIADNSKLIQDEVNKQLAVKTQTIESEKAALQNQVAMLQKNVSDNQAVIAQKASLEAQVAQLQRTAADSKSLAAEKAALQTQIAQLQKSATDAQALTAEKTALQAQIAQMQKSAANTQALAADKTALQAQVAQLQKSAAETQSLAAEKTTLQAQVVQLQKTVADAQALATEKAALQTRVAQLEKSAGEIESVKSEKNTLQAQVTQLQKAAADVQSLSAEKASLQAQLAQLTKTASDAQASAAQKVALEAQVAQLQKETEAAKAAAAEKTALAQQVATLQKALADKDATAGSDKIALQAQIDTLKGALTQKEQQLALANAQPKADPAADAKKIAEEVGKAKAASDQELIGLRTQLQAMTASIEGMKQQLAAKDKEVADAQTAAKAGAVNAKQLSDLMANVESIRKDNAATHDQLVAARQDADKYRMQLVDMQTSGATRADQVASMQLQLNEFKSQMEMKDRATATYQNQLATLQQDNAQLKARLSVADTNQSNSTSANSDLTRQIQSLQSQVRDLQRQNAAKADIGRSASADVYNAVTPAAGYVSSAAAAPVSRVTAQPVSMVTSAAAASNGFDKGSIQSLLKKSGLNVNGVQKASSGLAGADNFSWMDSNNVRGLASVKPLKSGGFDKAVNDYISYQKGQCAGDFASMPSPSNGSAAKQMSLYEVACVSSSGQSQSASLVFFEDQGQFIAVSNQIDAANMDIAMDSRDKIASFVKGL